MYLKYILQSQHAGADGKLSHFLFGLIQKNKLSKAKDTLKEQFSSAIEDQLVLLLDDLNGTMFDVKVQVLSLLTIEEWFQLLKDQQNKLKLKHGVEMNNEWRKQRNGGSIAKQVQTLFLGIKSLGNDDFITDEQLPLIKNSHHIKLKSGQIELRIPDPSQQVYPIGTEVYIIGSPSVDFDPQTKYKIHSYENENNEYFLEDLWDYKTFGNLKPCDTSIVYDIPMIRIPVNEDFQIEILVNQDYGGFTHFNHDLEASVLEKEMVYDNKYMRHYRVDPRRISIFKEKEDDPNFKTTIGIESIPAKLFTLDIDFGSDSYGNNKLNRYVSWSEYDGIEGFSTQFSLYDKDLEIMKKDSKDTEFINVLRQLTVSILPIDFHSIFTDIMANDDPKNLEDLLEKIKLYPGVIETIIFPQ